MGAAMTFCMSNPQIDKTEQNKTKETGFSDYTWFYVVMKKVFFKVCFASKISHVTRYLRGFTDKIV